MKKSAIPGSRPVPRSGVVPAHDTTPAKITVTDGPKRAEYGVRITAGEAIERISVWFPPAQLVSMDEFIVRLRKLAVELAAQDRR